MSSVFVQSRKYLIKKQTTTTKKIILRLLGIYNLQGWFRFGKHNNPKTPSLAWSPTPVWPVWMCNNTKWLVSDSSGVCRPPRQIMSCRGSTVRIPHKRLWTWRRKRQINFESETFRFVWKNLDTGMCAAGRLAGKRCHLVSGMFLIGLLRRWPDEMESQVTPQDQEHKEEYLLIVLWCENVRHHLPVCSTFWICFGSSFTREQERTESTNFLTVMSDNSAETLVLWDENHQPVPTSKWKALVVGRKTKVMNWILFEVPITHNLHTNSFVDLDLWAALGKSPSFVLRFIFLFFLNNLKVSNLRLLDVMFTGNAGILGFSITD